MFRRRGPVSEEALRKLYPAALGRGGLLGVQGEASRGRGFVIVK